MILTIDMYEILSLLPNDKLIVHLFFKNLIKHDSKKFMNINISNDANIKSVKPFLCLWVN